MNAVEITCIFDSDPGKIGKKLANIVIFPLSHLKKR